MPKKCDHCDFFHPENHLNECPNCGRVLQFTMFAPAGFQAEGFSEADSAEENTVSYEEIELPLSVRMTQIGAGVGIFCFVSRTWMYLFTALFFWGNDQIQIEDMVACALLFALAFHILGAIVGGAVAGAWSVDWVPQGIGVGLGVFFVPLILHLVFPQEDGMNSMSFFLLIAVTTAVTVFGAFLGHQLIRPARYYRY